MLLSWGTEKNAGGEGEIRTREAVTRPRALQARALDQAMRPLRLSYHAKLYHGFELVYDLNLCICFGLWVPTILIYFSISFIP